MEFEAARICFEVMKTKGSMPWEKKLIELGLDCGRAAALYLEYLRGDAGDAEECQC